MPQIERGHAIDVGKAAVSARVDVQASHQVEQATVSAVSDGNRQRLFIKIFDVAADDDIQQPTQSTLLRVVAADLIEFLLKSAESPQAVVLLRKPRIQVVHVSLFMQEKKPPSCTLGEEGGQMPFLQMTAAICAGVKDPTKLPVILPSSWAIWA
jgi:hypothetical protein